MARKNLICFAFLVIAPDSKTVVQNFKTRTKTGQRDLFYTTSLFITLKPHKRIDLIDILYAGARGGNRTPDQRLMSPAVDVDSTLDLID